MEINKANSFMKGSKKSVVELQAELTATAKRMNQKQKTINVPKVFKASFGDPAMFSVNGYRIEVPLGVDVLVPVPHFEHLQRLMKGAIFTKEQQTPEPHEIYSK